MPLTWNGTAIGDKPKTGVFSEKNGEWERTSYLCFMLMAVDVRSITEKNWKEVYGRIRMYEKLFGATFTKPCKHKRSVYSRVRRSGYDEKDYPKTKCRGHVTDGVGTTIGFIPVPYTAKHIKARIGYSTNVSGKNQTGFLAHLWKSWGYDYKQDVE
jgi:anaerobic selenocysteine-containing dehydrogenase